jgi:hypothetical protein
MTSGCYVNANHTYADQATIESDDYAALVSGHFPEIQADASFERGITHWSEIGGTWETPASGAAVGTRYPQLDSGTTIAPKVLVTDPESYNVALFVKKGTSTATGDIRVRVRARELDYSSDPHCTDTPNDWNYVSPVVGIWDTISNEYFEPTSSWVEVEGDEWDDLDDWDGAEIEIRVYNELSTGSAHVDYVRTEMPSGGGGGGGDT